MIQLGMFDAPVDEFGPPAIPYVVELCPACHCCHHVDGECLGACDRNGHRATLRRRNGVDAWVPAPEGGTWFLDYYLHPEWCVRRDQP